MVLGLSFASLGISAGGLLLFASAAPPLFTEILALVAVASTFAIICSAEARFAS